MAIHNKRTTQHLNWQSKKRERKKLAIKKSLQHQIKWILMYANRSESSNEHEPTNERLDKIRFIKTTTDWEIKR